MKDGGKGRTAGKSKRHRKNMKKAKRVQFSHCSKDDSRARLHQTHRSAMSRCNANRKQRVDSQSKTTFLTYSGDVLSTQDHWPTRNEAGIFRIMGANVNGISAGDDLIEWDITLGHMMDLQVDCLCLTEPNLDLHSYYVKDSIKHATKSFDRHMHLTMTSSSQPSLKKGSFYKPGGTITAVNGVWSGRVTRLDSALKGDRFNRWGTTHLVGRQSSIVTILTVYRVCKQRNGGGDNTIYLQQQSDMEKVLGKEVEPRKSLRHDLSIFINRLHEQGHAVILVGDLNENLKLSTNDFMMDYDTLISIIVKIIV